MQGLLARKIGQTEIFDDRGVQVHVTVLQVGPCVVVQRKNVAKDGYEAVQVGFEEQKESRMTKPVRGHYAKSGVPVRRVLREFPLDSGEDLKPGEAVTVSIFDGVSHVDVTGVTKGKGFQGVVRRHGMTGGLAGHGSMMHRRIGAIGNRTWPARVFKNKRMPGQMGNVQMTVQNLKVAQVRLEDNVLLVRGAVPGPVGALLVVRKALKKTAKAATKS
ncbi:MAG: 50S ribosomal protein L3 [Verrucomicrobia bacterium]|nr:50S ribosomal protein L3 [Verrucomicrobiota bacterium]MBU1909785.1 50S ribosomal protein L3 [Verrucomicrobiota bacterium]